MNDTNHRRATNDMNDLNSASSMPQMWKKQFQAFFGHYVANNGETNLALSGRSAFVLAWLYTKSEVNDSVPVPGDWQAFPFEFVNEIGNPGPLTKEDFGVRELVDKGFIELNRLSSFSYESPRRVCPAF